MKKIIWGGAAVTEAGEPAKTNFGVLVDGSRIVDSGAKNDLAARHPGVELAGGAQYMLLPSMVDSHDHGHTLSPVSFGINDDFLEAWLVALEYQPSVNPYLMAAIHGLRLVCSGVTSVVHYHNPANWMNIPAEADAAIRGLRDAGLRVIFCVPFRDQNHLVHDGEAEFLASLPQPLLETAKGIANPLTPHLDAYQQLFTGLFNRHHDREQHLVHVVVNPLGGQWCSDQGLVALKELSQKLGARMQTHLLESQYQKYYAFRKWGKSFVQHLEEIGVLGPWLTLAHMVHVEPEDLPLLAERSVSIASNPSSNLRLQCGIASLAKMKAAGVNVGIGLDSLALDDDQDYLRELRLAWVLGKVRGMSIPRLSSHDVLGFGTSGGAAAAFGKEAPIGRLLPGYFADLLLVDYEAVKGLWMTPRADPLDTLLYHARREHVKYVMVNGEWVVKEGVACGLNQDEIRAEVRKVIESQKDAALWANAEHAKKLVPYVYSHYAKWDEEAASSG